MSHDIPAEDVRSMEHYRRVPLTELTTPADGRIVRTNRYWAVTQEDEALFWCGPTRRHDSPQCNHDKNVVHHLLPRGCKVVFVPVAYLKHRCSDYV